MKVQLQLDAEEVAKIILDKVGIKKNKNLSDYSTVELIEELGNRTGVDIRDLYNYGNLIQKIVTVDVYA